MFYKISIWALAILFIVSLLLWKFYILKNFDLVAAATYGHQDTSKKINTKVSKELPLYLFEVQKKSGNSFVAAKGRGDLHRVPGR